jgi:hypothetical protein
MSRTMAMEEVVRKFKTQARVEAEICVARTSEALRAASVTLPLVNERGEKVFHRDRLEADGIALYWNVRARAVWDQLSRLDQDSLEKQFRYRVVGHYLTEAEVTR